MRHWPKRTLAASAYFYRVPLTNAHSAAADAEATVAVLLKMVRSRLIPDDVDLALHEQAVHLKTAY